MLGGCDMLAIHLKLPGHQLYALENGMEIRRIARCAEMEKGGTTKLTGGWYEHEGHQITSPVEFHRISPVYGQCMTISSELR